MGGKSKPAPMAAPPASQTIFYEPPYDDSKDMSSVPALQNPVAEPEAPIATPTAPEEPRELTPEEISAISGAESERQKAGNLKAPEYARIDPQMTPLQARTRIATLGASGDLGTDPDIFDIYRSYAFSSLGGGEQSPLPVEQEYIKNVFGESPKEGTGGFLSAIERIYGRGRR